MAPEVIIVSHMRPFALTLLVALLALPAAGAQAQPPDATPGYYFMLGRHLESAGKIDEAIAAHQRAIALAPDSAELRAELAGLYARQDRAREALDTAEDALKRDPDNREANRVIGSVYAALSEQKKAFRPGDDPSSTRRRHSRP